MEFINEQDDATLQRFVERLEFRGRDLTFVAYREAYLDTLELGRSTRVLELGCGTGVVARALASRAGFSGPIIAVDQSPVLLEAARRLAAEEGSATGSNSAWVTRTRWTWPTPASTPSSRTPW